MNDTRTLADELRGLGMKWVWIIATAIVFVFGLGITPWDALINLLENQGVGDEEKNLVAFVAGYTLPLTAGFFTIFLLILMGKHRQVDWMWQLVGAAAILAGAAWVARYLGLGLLPSYPRQLPGGPIYVAIPVFVLTGYLNTYGTGLMISAFAIGFAGALQVERWLHHAV